MTGLHAPPVLSTPDTHIFEDPTPPVSTEEPRLSDQEVYKIYEIGRTAKEIREGRWKRIALQFPDDMLKDAPRVFQFLEAELRNAPVEEAPKNSEAGELLEQSFNRLPTISTPTPTFPQQRHRLYILADTSYGACCVDEIAAEHVDAEVVVHYGRSCLSPTARLPVIYVFTSRPLPLKSVIEAFENTYPVKDTRVILMADIIYNSQIPPLFSKLQDLGYTNIIAPKVIHDPSSMVPNRLLDPLIDTRQYSLFHISDPPPALLLTLTSRLAEMHIYPTTSSSPKTLIANTSLSLRRRYALLTSLSTNSIYGILINTLSVRNYLPVISTIRDQIAAAGKKSYTFVVGKVNAAKIANFSEIGGWVVVGCWESSLIENKEFYRPVITPFELGLVLMGDRKRVWSGEWRGDFNEVLEIPSLPRKDVDKETRSEEQEQEKTKEENDSEEESAPPEFDLRTGRYVSHSRPMHSANSTNTSSSTQKENEKPIHALMKRSKGDLVTINGHVSPGAEYLRSQRTWMGLGSDFHMEEASTSIEEGRSGVARGYSVGEGEKR